MKLMDFKNFIGMTAKAMILSSVFAYGCSKPADGPGGDDNEPLAETVITDFQPQKGAADNLVTITGENFGTDRTNVRITFGGGQSGQNRGAFRHQDCGQSSGYRGH